ncbi:hypothetical protein MX101_02095 [Streptococcus uberis]|nr:hypothetical protein [Streptococcus uberis]MCK1254908.1 hypothetical protein [Streptococcus uberis]
MVKVNVGTMSAQASSVSAIVSQRVSALTDAKQSLSSFASQDQLKGAAYQNAKAYATSVLGPLIDGMILLSEETEKGVTKLQTLYAEKCGSESLDSEVLTDKIEKDQELLIKIQDLQAHLDKHASFLSHALDGLEATVKARLRKNKKKLKNLMEFNAESSSVFEALAEFQDSVSTGLSFVSTGFNNFNGTFDTSGKGLEWTKTIQTGMKKREDSKAKELKKKKEEQKESLENVNNVSKIVSYGSTANLASREGQASLKKIMKGTWKDKPVKSTKSGVKTWKQVNGEVNRFKDVKKAKHIDETLNGTGKLSKGTGIKGAAKSVGYIGGTMALLDGITTYLDREEKYGKTSAAIDGVAHTGTAVGAMYAGAYIGSLIPIPVVGTLAGAATGYLVGGLANTIYDGVAHNDWDLDNFALW